MANNTQKMSYDAGVAKGQAQEKTSNMMDKATNAAQSAKDACLAAGDEMKAQIQGATDSVQKATGMKK